jgi:DNA-directed RNA polymerase subunit RPC12/RpoP
MSERKYTCPHCGQNIAYTDDYSGLQIPCPRCQTSIIFPGLAAPKQTSSLRLAGPIAPPKAKFQFNFANIVKLFREFKHWKIAGVCAIPFVLVAGAVVAASVYNRHDASPAAAVAVPVATPVDANALDKLTDLTRADQVVQEKLAAVAAAAQACQSAEHKQQVARSQHPPANPTTMKAVDAADARAHQALIAARKAFDAAFAQYQKLGGTVDYRSQLPGGA